MRHLFLFAFSTLASAPALAANPATGSTLAQFTAATRGDGTALSWALAPSATNVAYVVVQFRPSALADWQPLTTLPAAAGARGHFRAPGQPGSAYRLVTMDADGTPAFSRVLAVR